MESGEIDKLAIAEDFSGHWSLGVSASRFRLTQDEVLNILAQDEVLLYLDERSRKLEKLYRRMPQYIAPQMIMWKMATAERATEIAPVVNAFIKWFDSAPPPSEREFAQQLMAIFSSQQ